MIGDGKGGGGTGVQLLSPQFLANRDQAGAAQRPVDVDCAIDRRDAVFREDDDPCPIAPRVLDDFGAQRVDLVQVYCGPRAAGSVALQYIVEMRQIDQREGRVALAPNMERAAHDPLACYDSRGLAPETEK